jgi:predicted XRE-type DNA-binding protein
MISASPYSDPATALKKQLCDDIRQYIVDHGLSNSKAADVFGVQRHRIIDIQQGRYEQGFTIDYLINMLARVGIQPLRHSPPAA